MKRITIIFLALTLTLVLVACGGTDGGSVSTRNSAAGETQMPANEPKSTETEAAEEQKPQDAADTIMINELECTVSEVASDNGEVSFTVLLPMTGIDFDPGPVVHGNTTLKTPDGEVINPNSEISVVIVGSDIGVTLTFRANEPLDKLTLVYDGQECGLLSAP